jgi:hypothetical protein
MRLCVTTKCRLMPLSSGPRSRSSRRATIGKFCFSSQRRGSGASKSLWQYVQGTRVSATLDFPNTASGRSSALTVAVPGATFGDFVNVSPAEVGLLIVGSFYLGVVSDNGTVSVLFVNQSAGAIDPPSGLFQIQVIPQ